MNYGHGYPQNSFREVRVLLLSFCPFIPPPQVDFASNMVCPYSMEAEGRGRENYCCALSDRISLLCVGREKSGGDHILCSHPSAVELLYTPERAS